MSLPLVEIEWRDFTAESPRRQTLRRHNGLVAACLPPYNIQDPEEGGEVDEQFAANVLGDSLESYTFPEMGEYMLSRELYSQLDMDSVGRVNNLDYNTFYTTESDSALGKLYQLDVNLGGLTLTDSILAQQQILLAATLNNSVLPTYSFEGNEKEINNIYLNYMQYGWDSLSAVEKNFVETLAKSCIYSHGYGVYKARMLWANVEPAFDFNDLYICTAGNSKTDIFGDIKAHLNQQTGQKKNETAAMRENSVILYPNPARDEIKLKHSYRDVSSLRIEIYDYAGRKLGTVQCTNCMQEVSMQVADFASGLYTYKVIINDNSVSNGKISIIK
jgi:hypothetical protein